MHQRLLLIVCVVAIGMLPISSSFSAMNGLVGAWLFDDNEGNKAIDSSGKGYDGELIGNAKLDKNGKYGSAVATDGTEAYVMVPDSEDFEFKDDFTIACWFQNETAPADPSGIVTKGYDKTAANGGDAKPWYLVYYLNAGTIDMFLRDTQATNSRAVGKTTIKDAKWHHVVGMKAGNKVKIYIDGKEDGSADAVDAVYGQNDKPLVFMVHYERWLKGMIDEVAIFNRAITDKEITQIMGGLQNVLAVDPKGKLAATWSQLKSNL